MKRKTNFKINTKEEFPHLKNAPIVEAVVDFRAVSEVTWEETEIKKKLTEIIPDYPKIESRRGLKSVVKIKRGTKASADHTLDDLGWEGFRLSSDDKPHIAQFNKDGFSFSRLHPYINWEQFINEAFRLWKFYLKLSRPSEIQRIGVRFINRIMLPIEDLNLDDYYQVSPKAPEGLDLDFAKFLHHDTLVVPGDTYAINIIKTVQPHKNPEIKKVGLIVDIDVFTFQPITLRNSIIEKRMNEMRWLKNKAFFGTITPKALEMLK